MSGKLSPPAHPDYVHSGGTNNGTGWNKGLAEIEDSGGSSGDAGGNINGYAGAEGGETPPRIMADRRLPESIHYETFKRYSYIPIPVFTTRTTADILITPWMVYCPRAVSGQ